MQSTELESTGFELLSRMISGFDGVILLGAPALLMGLVALIFVALVRRKRTKDAELLATPDDKLPHKEKPVLADPSQQPEEPVPEPVPTHVAPKKPEDVSEILASDRQSWLGALKKGLLRTRQAIGAGLSELFSGSVKIDSALLERIHETLYRADIGVKSTDKLVASIRTKFGDGASPAWEEVQLHLVSEIAKIFGLSERPLNHPAKAPFVILVVGVNGVGKTTTIGKLTARFIAEGKSVLLGAADTYRAAAIEQLETWGKRLGVEVIRHQQGSDPAAVAYDALKAAVARDMDVLIIDTAGRLHNKTELMDELGKIHRVLGRDVPGAPHETWLVIDATTGQNASTQVKAFKEVANVTGLVVTKLDGTAKGGVLIGIADQYNVPIRYIGVGEKATDLQPFDSEEFAKAIF